MWLFDFPPKHDQHVNPFVVDDTSNAVNQLRPQTSSLPSIIRTSSKQTKNHSSLTGGCVVTTKAFFTYHKSFAYPKKCNVAHGQGWAQMELLAIKLQLHSLRHPFVRLPPLCISRATEKESRPKPSVVQQIRRGYAKSTDRCFVHHASSWWWRWHGSRLSCIIAGRD